MTYVSSSLGRADFAHHYRELVLPQLARLTKAEAACVCAKVESFNGAYDGIMNQARLLGALFLPNAILADLEDWIATTLLEEILARESRCAT